MAQRNAHGSLLHERTCETCGTTWQTTRPEARFCTAKCKGVHLSTLNQRKCPPPDDHPVLLAIAAIKLREQQEREASKPAPYAWRTARECPGCACWFTPLRTSTALCCSTRCARRVAKRRRRARERNTLNDWRWSDFMRVAQRFDFCCAYCGTNPGQLEPDHVVPLSRGGADAVSNLLPSCHQCNADKNARTLTEWAEWRAVRGKPARVTTWRMGDPRYVHLCIAQPSAVA